MKKYENEIWGIIPARGGSKSIPLKNLVNLNGRPLIEYVIEAAKASEVITRIICSTENNKIKSLCLEKNIEVHIRPKELAADDTNVLDVLIFLLEQFQKTEGILPFLIVLLQPTSPFTLSDQIDSCVHDLIESEFANSSQTVSEFPHNYHAFNQRIIEDGRVAFRFSKDRKKYYNKQTKPKFYIFGNLVVIRSSALLQRKEIFPIPSIPNVIPFHYALDVDGPEDLELAEWYLSQGRVVLPHMD